MHKSKNKDVLEILVGIDPGRHGAVVGLHPSDKEKGKYNVLFKMDVSFYNKDKNILDEMATILSWKPTNSKESKSQHEGVKIVNDIQSGAISTTVYIEKVHSMPTDSKQSAFTFGMIFGQLIKFATIFLSSVVDGANIYMIPVQTWKKLIGIKKKEEAKDKIKDYIVMDDYGKMIVDADRLDVIEAALIAIAGHLQSIAPSGEKN